MSVTPPSTSASAKSKTSLPSRSTSKLTFLIILVRFGVFLVLAVAISLGIIGKTQPELFLRVPELGFVLYHIFGGKPIPPFFDNELYRPDNFRQWVRDGDVIVATGAKSGTTWLCYCAHAVRTKGQDSPLGYRDIMLSTPWMEMAQFPGQTWAERLYGYNTTVLEDGSHLKDYWDHPSYPFRVFKSHYTPDEAVGGAEFQNVLPVRRYPGVKYVVAARNGMWSFRGENPLQSVDSNMSRLQSCVRLQSAHARVHGQTVTGSRFQRHNVGKIALVCSSSARGCCCPCLYST